MMSSSPRVERFTTVAAGDGSATFIICLSHSVSFDITLNVGSRHLPVVYVRLASKLKRQFSTEGRKLFAETFTVSSYIFLLQDKIVCATSIAAICFIMMTSAANSPPISKRLVKNLAAEK